MSSKREIEELLLADNEVKHELVREHKLPPLKLAVLSYDIDSLLRGKVALHPCTAKGTLLRLVEDKSVLVTTTLAQRTKLHAEVAEKLIEQGDPHILLELAANSTLAEEVYAELYGLRSEAIILKLASNPGIGEKLADRIYKENNVATRERLASNPSLSASRQEELVTIGSDYTRLALSKNPALTPSLHWPLAKDIDPHVRGNVANVEGVDFLILEALANDADGITREIVRAMVHSLPNYEASIIAGYLNSFDDYTDESSF